MFQLLLTLVAKRHLTSFAKLPIMHMGWMQAAAMILQATGPSQRIQKIKKEMQHTDKIANRDTAHVGTNPVTLTCHCPRDSKEFSPLQVS